MATTQASRYDDVRISLIYERNVPIRMRDGVEIRANVYRPVDGVPAPVLMTFGPYGKDTPLALRQADHWAKAGGGVFLNWETPDPEHWVPRGFVVVRVDSRGSWTSPGKMDWISKQQAVDYYDAIEWAGSQPWSTGKVGLLGISYFAFSQWSVAVLQPPHLAAMVPWEGAADAYRDFLRHGGISGEFIKMASQRQVERAYPGSEAVDVYKRVLEHPMDDGSYGFSPDLSRITVPLLSVGNWGNLMLHLRGNVEGFVNASSKDKYLRIVTGGHFLPFYEAENLAMQEEFLARFLKGDQKAWTNQPKVRVVVRDPRGAKSLDASDWPIPNTRWVDYALDADSGSLRSAQPNIDSAAALPSSNGVVAFKLPPVTERTVILGPAMLRVWLSSESPDADVYVRVRQILASGEEFRGIDPSGKPIQTLAEGWLRASHRELDESRSLPYRPYHTHRNRQLLPKGVPVPLDIEVWPTSIVLDRGDTLILELGSSDEPGASFEWGGRSAFWKLGADPADRDPQEFAGPYTIHTGPSHPGYLRLPILE